MDFKEYQRLSSRTINEEQPVKDQLQNMALGLSGEAGEVADLIKKALYHGHQLDVGKLRDELGDLLWYVQFGCSIFGLSLEEVAQRNVEKLRERWPEGFKKGEENRMDLHRSREEIEKQIDDLIERRWPALEALRKLGD